MSESDKLVFHLERIKSLKIQTHKEKISLLVQTENKNLYVWNATEGKLSFASVYRLEYFEEVSKGAQALKWIRICTEITVFFHVVRTE